MVSRNATAAAAEAFRPLLWSLAYRMTGTVQDADDVVQDTLLAALENPPKDPTKPLKPWLVTVALNRARDRLRSRRRTVHLGPWLPAPVPDDRLADDQLADRQTASWAFLRAAEAMTPTQRAVFLAREVLDLSAAETAEALGCSPGGVDVALHRARRALADLPAIPGTFDDAVLVSFLTCLHLGMVGAATKLLHPDAVAINDGAGVVNAARIPVVGARKIVNFCRRIERLYPPGVKLHWRRCNGMLTVILESPRSKGRQPQIATFSAEFRDHRIVRLYSVLDPRKLGAILG